MKHYDRAKKLHEELKRRQGFYTVVGPELNDSDAAGEQYVWQIGGQDGYYFLIVFFSHAPTGSDGAIWGPFPTIEFMEEHATDNESVGQANVTPDHREMADMVERIAGSRTSAPARSGSALDAVNRHRRKTGQRELDPGAAGWTPEDVELEAQRIARLNPEQVELKRRLMR